jgi:hypothetical protein
MDEVQTLNADTRDTNSSLKPLSNIPRYVIVIHFHLTFVTTQCQQATSTMNGVTVGSGKPAHESYTCRMLAGLCCTSMSVRFCTNVKTAWSNKVLHHSSSGRVGNTASVDCLFVVYIGLEGAEIVQSV